MKSITQAEMKRQRQEAILSSLDVMGFATREQLQKKHNLGTDRNALKVLREMKDYFQIRTHEGRNVYYLSAKGRELVGSENEMKWSLQVDHYLMRNDIWLYYYSPKDWEIETPIEITSGLNQHVVIPDASFTLEGRYHFVEVDRIQTMAKNKEKIEHYTRINPLILKCYGHVPVLIFYTTSSTRKEKIKQLCLENNLDFRVYSKDDLR